MPRYAFIPRQAWACPLRGEGYWIDRDIDPDGWWAAVCGNTSIVTQIDDGRTKLTADAVRQTTNFSSAASAPSLVFGFLGLLGVRPGDRVLEIGTGTGWTTGLLTYLAGQGQVTTVEVDRRLAAVARENLRRAGCVPRLIIGDGAEGVTDEGPFDRVHVTCGVLDIPYAWVAQTRPGGTLVLPWMRVGQMVRLTVGPDGTASGTFHGECGYMLLRDQRAEKPDTADETRPAEATDEDAGDEERTGPTTVDPRLVLAPSHGREVFMAGALPGVDIAGFDQGQGGFSVVLHQGASHALVNAGRSGARVMQRGPRNLWDEAVHAYDRWVEAGFPGLDRLGLTVTPQRQYIWLDGPDTPVSTGR